MYPKLIELPDLVPPEKAAWLKRVYGVETLDQLCAFLAQRIIHDKELLSWHKDLVAELDKSRPMDKIAIRRGRTRIAARKRKWARDTKEAQEQVTIDLDESR